MTLTKDTSKGLTTKVMKGSFWVLMGQVLPLAATFVASPFVIRTLGSETYGVLIAIGLISTYFAFGDFGMAIASTRFGAEAYAAGKPVDEGKVVRTAALIGLSSSLLIAIPMFSFSGWVVEDMLNVPVQLRSQASTALKITSVGYVMGFIGNIYNTPQLSRMRQDLNVLINAGFKILMTLITPVVLYFGGGIIDATFVATAASFMMMVGNIVVSGRLLPQLYQWTIDRDMLKPLFKFGGNYLFYGIGLLVTNNLEKLMLAKYVSVKSLAYYSVASTFANMTTIFSLAMVQTLIPAFSQLLSPDKREQLKSLFERCVKIGLIGVIPSVMMLLIIAKPFFTIWAGPEFGSGSIWPFYILLVGVFFSLLVYVPNTILLSAGRSYLFGRYYLAAILPYTAITYLMIHEFGIMGAAAAWSLREIISAFFFIYYTRRHTGLSLRLGEKMNGALLGISVFIPAVLFAFLYNNFSVWLILLLPVCLATYGWVVWNNMASDDEKIFVRNKLPFFFKKSADQNT